MNYLHLKCLKHKKSYVSREAILVAIHEKILGNHKTNET